MHIAKIALGMIAGASILSASPILAHTKLVSSIPAANAAVKVGPKTITLTFNEKLVPTFSSFKLSMPAHQMAIAVTTAVSRDGKQIVGTLKNALGAGSYTIAWTAAGSDGHKMKGDLAFKVG